MRLALHFGTEFRLSLWSQLALQDGSTPPQPMRRCQEPRMVPAPRPLPSKERLVGPCPTEPAQPGAPVRGPACPPTLAPRQPLTGVDSVVPPLPDTGFRNPAWSRLLIHFSGPLGLEACHLSPLEQVTVTLERHVAGLLSGGQTAVPSYPSWSLISQSPSCCLPRVRGEGGVLQPGLGQAPGEGLPAGRGAYS